MIILGIDPGYAIVGYGLIEIKGNKFSVIDYGAITTKAHTPMSLRLSIIFEELTAIIDKYKPEAIAIEELFFNTNAKTAIMVAHARGVIVVAAQRGGSNVYEYTPLQVKQAVVGYGRAQKTQIQEMVKVLLNLESVPKPDDVADALSVAICHANSANFSEQFRI